MGYGLSAAAAFFHRPSGWNLEAARDAFERGEAVSPPSVSLAAGGGDHDYWQGTLSAAGWGRLGGNLTLGVRGLAGSVGDGAPFWSLPTVHLRGVPARQYSGSSEVQGEGEVRWDLDSRWSLVGFGGLGWTRSEVLGGAETRTVGAAGGGGVRYLLARAFGIRGGIDVAYGPDGGAFYVTMGSAWH